MNSRQKAEKVVEAFAASFLEDTISHNLFIGSHIERLLADKVHVIYQYVEDETYYGAAITDQNGEQFVAFNMFHPLRTCYFTAAHELWHLTEGSTMQDDAFDHERAADRVCCSHHAAKGLKKSAVAKIQEAMQR